MALRRAWLQKISKAVTEVNVDKMPDGERVRLKLDAGDPDLAIDNKHLLYVNENPPGELTKWKYIKSTQLSGTLQNLVNWIQDSLRLQSVNDLAQFEVDDIHHFNAKFIHTAEVGEQSVHFLNYPYLLTEAPLRDIERVLTALTTLQNDRLKKATAGRDETEGKSSGEASSGDATDSAGGESTSDNKQAGSGIVIVKK